ncbi:MAG: PHP domain-containing protein [Candidatus Lokiarchaeota archaeon]|nr:PHP domain-containing protein [Candidatus Lokiarchaeota archaeon]
MPIFDMHIHLKNRSPCSHLSIVDLKEGLSEKYDGICITDHHIVNATKTVSHIGVKVFFGVEITTDLGDILAYGIESVPVTRRAEEVINFIHKNGGVAVCAHPFSPHHSCFQDAVQDYNFDAIEINGSLANKYNVPARKIAEILDLPTIGGSDAHSKDQLNKMGTKFSIKIKKMADMVRAIKEKKCKATKIY